jgi:hypothetical protein
VTRLLAALTVVEIVAGATVLAALYCRAVPEGHPALFWRRVRSLTRPRPRLRQADMIQMWRLP